MKRNRIFAVIILIIFLVSGIYLLKTKKTETDLTPDWKTYIVPHKGYQIKYPEDWKLDTSSDALWSQDLSPVDRAPSFTLSKKDYSMTFKFPDAFAPGMCIFPDNPDFTKPLSDDSSFLNIYKCSEYTQVKGNYGAMYRRIIVKPSKSDLTVFSVYTKTNDKWVTIPVINYYLLTKPDNTDILIQMDKILSTFKFTN